MQARCGNVPAARGVSSHAPALQHHPTPTHGVKPFQALKPVVAISTTTARLSSTALRSNEPAGSVTQVSADYFLADCAEQLWLGCLCKVCDCTISASGVAIVPAELDRAQACFGRRGRAGTS